MKLNCEDIIRQHINRGMTEEEILAFAQEGKKLARQAKAAQAAANATPNVRALANSWKSNKKLEALAKKRAAEFQAAARLKAVTYASDNFQGMEWEGISALMVGSRYARTGARYSVDSVRSSLTGRYVGGLLHDLEKIDPKYARLFRDDAMAREVSEALWILDAKGAAYNGPPEAMELARVIHKWQEVAREDENGAGAWINKLPGYICRQSHDAAKLKRAGFNAWKDDIENRLDWSRTASGRVNPNDAAAVNDFLYEVYLGLVSGMHQKFAPPGQTPAPDPVTRRAVVGTTAAKASQHRVLHFKSGGDWFDYNARFGTGSMAEAVISGLTRSANDTALMRIFGPSPQANLDSMIQDIKLAYRAKGDDAAIRKAANFTRRLHNQMAELDGSLNADGNAGIATVSRCVRALESMAKLGGALISGFSDIPLFAQEMKYQGRGFFRSMAEGLELFAKGRGSLEEKAILSQCGVFFDSMAGNLAAKFAGQDIPGKITAMMNMFFRLNGLSFWSDAWKKSATLMMAHDLALAAPNDFASLSKQRQRLLSLYNIDADIWDMLRQSKLSAADGRDYLTADAAYSIPAQKIEAYMTSRGMLTSQARTELFREEIADRLRACYRDRVQYAVLEPDARTAAILHQGQPAGTVTGEALRFVTQFKSFPTVFLQRTFAREIYGRGADTALKGLARSVIPHGGELGGLCGMILATTAFGYLSMSAKAMLAGRTPRDFTESPEQFGKVFLAALVQGGGAGLYGDFLLGEKSRMGDDFLSSLAGPALGTASSLVSLYKSMRDGEDISSTAFRTFWSCVPGNNLFWTKAALDHMLLYSLREWLNPGSTARLRRKIARETNQDFYIDPTIWDWAKP